MDISNSLEWKCPSKAKFERSIHTSSTDQHATVLCMQITKKFILFPFRDKTKISWVVAYLIYSLQSQLTSIKLVLLIYCSMQLERQFKIFINKCPISLVSAHR